MKKWYLLFLISVLFAIEATAAIRKINGVEYSTASDGTAVAKLLNIAEGDIEIPSSVDINGKTYTVVRIGKAYTSALSRVYSVKIPATVTQIDKGAFRGCTNLAKLYIPTKPVNIEEGAFEKCRNIKSITTNPRGGNRDIFLAAIPNPDIVEPDTIDVLTQIIHQVDTIQEIIKVGKDPCTLNLKCEPATAKASIEGMEGATYQGDAKISNLTEGTYRITFTAEDYEPLTKEVTLKEGETLDCVAQLKAKPKPTVIDVDNAIPVNKYVNENTLALIIANETYKLDGVSKVLMAENDGNKFEEYCHKVLGLPTSNITKLLNASEADTKRALKQLKNRTKTIDGGFNILFYYAGHGMPDESSKEAFLMTTDADGMDTEIGCLSLNSLYSQLSDMSASNVFVFIDACFSGGSREGDVINKKARGTLQKPATAKPQGRMVIFTAATDKQTAMPYEAQHHGLFTYFLLKKLNETKGRVSLGELGDYLTKEVANQSWKINNKEQTPTVMASQMTDDNWKNIILVK